MAFDYCRTYFTTVSCYFFLILVILWLIINLISHCSSWITCQVWAPAGFHKLKTWYPESGSMWRVSHFQGLSAGNQNPTSYPSWKFHLRKLFLFLSVPSNLRDVMVRINHEITEMVKLFTSAIANNQDFSTFKNYPNTYRVS